MSAATAYYSNSRDYDMDPTERALREFDRGIDELGEYPAKHIINNLTMIAENRALAPHIVKFIEGKLQRVSPKCKLPIFYLMDSIMKNVRGDYLSLFSRNIVHLYAVCIEKVPPEDLRRFIHVLNTWDTVGLFRNEDIHAMRQIADAASVRVPKSLAKQPVSYSAVPRANMGGMPPSRNYGTQYSQASDMELRRLLTQLQNDMRIHPTQHMSLEEVRRSNPTLYSQLLDYRDVQTQNTPPRGYPAPSGHLDPYSRPNPGSSRVEASHGSTGYYRSNVSGLNGPSTTSVGSLHQRNTASSQYSSQYQHQSRGLTHANGGVPSRNQPNSHISSNLSIQDYRSGGLAKNGSHNTSIASTPQTTTRSANALQLMKLLKQKEKESATKSGHEVTVKTKTTVATPILKDSKALPTAMANPSALMSILQKALKGKDNKTTTSMTSTPQTSPASSMESSPLGSPPSRSPPSEAPPMAVSIEKQEIKQIKERVEKNIQALYASLPLVCRQTGLRFKKQVDLDKHLDFLFQYNRTQRERAKGGISRSWYPSEELWATDFRTCGDTSRGETSGSFFDVKETVEETEESADSSVPADESIRKCRICGETFVKFWDEEEEEWMYKNAVEGIIHISNTDNEQEASIFHKHCYDAVISKSGKVSLDLLAPGTPQSPFKSPQKSWKPAIDAIKNTLREPATKLQFDSIKVKEEILSSNNEETVKEESETKDISIDSEVQVKEESIKLEDNGSDSEKRPLEGNDESLDHESKRQKLKE